MNKSKILIIVLFIISLIFIGCEDKNSITSLDSDDQDVQDLLIKAKKSANNTYFSDAKNALNEARKIDDSNIEYKQMVSYVDKKHDEYKERKRKKREAREEQKRQEQLSQQSQSYNYSSSSSQTKSQKRKFTCKFHCVGQWDSWRGREQTVQGYGTYSGEAQDWVKKNYKSQCAKNFPFYKGGGGSASVGKVSCN